MGGICDARCQAWRKQIIHNENRGRMNWFIKNREKLLENLEQEDKGKMTKLEEQCEPWTAKLETNGFVEDMSSAASTKCDEKSNLCFMKPVDPSLLDILYDKKMQSHEARKKYLKERAKKAPEDRYYLLDCSNWAYGWKIKKFQSFPSKTFNRMPIIRNSFYRRNLTSLKNESRPAQKQLPVAAKNFKAIQEY